MGQDPGKTNGGDASDLMGHDQTRVRTVGQTRPCEMERRVRDHWERSCRRPIRKSTKWKWAEIKQRETYRNPEEIQYEGNQRHIQKQQNCTYRRADKQKNNANKSSQVQNLHENTVQSNAK